MCHLLHTYYILMQLLIMRFLEKKLLKVQTIYGYKPLKVMLNKIGTYGFVLIWPIRYWNSISNWRQIVLRKFESLNWRIRSLCEVRNLVKYCDLYFWDSLSTDSLDSLLFLNVPRTKFVFWKNNYVIKHKYWFHFKLHNIY